MNIKKIILICSKIVSMISLMAATEQISTLSLPREAPWGVTISPDTEHQTSSLHSFTICTFLRPEYSSLSQDIWILHIKEIIICYTSKKSWSWGFWMFKLYLMDGLTWRSVSSGHGYWLTDPCLRFLDAVASQVLAPVSIYWEVYSLSKIIGWCNPYYSRTF